VRDEPVDDEQARKLLRELQGRGVIGSGEQAYENQTLMFRDEITCVSAPAGEDPAGNQDTAVMSGSNQPAGNGQLTGAQRAVEKLIQEVRTDHRERRSEQAAWPMRPLSDRDLIEAVLTSEYSSLLQRAASIHRVGGSPAAIAVAAALHAGCPQPLVLTPGIWPGCGVMS
jgi:hypothetical protein